MPTDYGSRARAVDIHVTGNDLRLGPFDVGRTTREKSGRECVIGGIRNIDRFGQIAHFDDAKDGSEDFFAADAKVWLHVGENRWWNEVTFVRHVPLLISQGRFLFA